MSNELPSSKPFAVLANQEQNPKQKKATGVPRPMMFKRREAKVNQPTITEDLARKAEADAVVVQLQTEIQAWVPGVMDAIRDVEATEEMVRQAKDPTDRIHAQATRDTLLDSMGNFNEVSSLLTRYMWEKGTDSESKAARRGSWIGFFTYWFAQNWENMGELIACLRDLCDRKYLVEAKDGQFKVGNRGYSLANQADLDDRDIQDLQQKLQNALAMLKRKERDRGQALLSGDDNISTAEVLDGQWGQGAIFVPPHEVILPDKTKVWKYGPISYATDGKKICIADGAGGMRGITAVMANRQTFITVERLNAYMEDGGMTEGESITLHGYLLRILALGIRNEREQVERAQILELFRAGASTSPARWMTEHTQGTICLEHRGNPWELPNGKKLQNLFALIERFEKDGTSWIRVVDVPPHVADYLPVNGQEFEEGTAFAGLLSNEDPRVKTLGAMLRAVYGQVSRPTRNK